MLTENARDRFRYAYRSIMACVGWGGAVVVRGPHEARADTRESRAGQYASVASCERRSRACALTFDQHRVQRSCDGLW